MRSRVRARGRCEHVQANHLSRRRRARGRPSEHLASRLEVGEILRGGAVPALELRASMIVGSGSASWQIVRDLAARLPFMEFPRWLDSKSCPIALADVGLREAAAGALASEGPGSPVARAV